METYCQDILDIHHGVIFHQVNCQGRIGAGLSGYLIEKWPVVRARYEMTCASTSVSNLLGKWEYIPVSKNIAVINSYSQKKNGNAYKTGRNYTNMDLLVKNLEEVCEDMYGFQRIVRHDPLWIPYKLGCGLAGGNWEELTERIKDLPINVARL